MAMIPTYSFISEPESARIATQVASQIELLRRRAGQVGSRLPVSPRRHVGMKSGENVPGPLPGYPSWLFRDQFQKNDTGAWQANFETRHLCRICRIYTTRSHRRNVVLVLSDSTA